MPHGMVSYLINRLKYVYLRLRIYAIPFMLSSLSGCLLPDFSNLNIVWEHVFICPFCVFAVYSILHSRRVRMYIPAYLRQVRVLLLRSRFL